MTSITVRWDIIPWPERNGAIQGYAVKYQKSGSQSDDFAVSLIPTFFQDSWYKRKATLKNLEVGTKYLIQVAGYTQDGIGIYSSALEVETNQCKFQIL